MVACDELYIYIYIYIGNNLLSFYWILCIFFAGDPFSYIIADTCKINVLVKMHCNCESIIYVYTRQVTLT